MAIIVTNAAEMADMLSYYVRKLREQGDAAQMLILPISAIEKPEEVIDMLGTVEAYAELEPSDPCSDGAIGILRFSGEQTISDAIRDLEGPLKSVHLMTKALEAAMPTTTTQEIEAVQAAVAAGTAILIDFAPMGKLAINKAKFAAATGLPEKGSTSREYRVTLLTPEKNRHVLVATTGAADVAVPTDDLLSPYLERVRNRGAHDNNTLFTMAGLSSGPALRAQPKFAEFVALMRPGYGFVVSKNARGGLTIPY